jgi:hypothetical protein
VNLNLNRKSYFFILVLLLLPLFYLNVKNTHDWGDDFAQYFIQARNILEGRPQTDNGLVFDKQTGEYALQAYPVGFPLILSATWKVFGDSVLVSSILISLFFFGFGMVSFFYFRNFFSEIMSILLVLVIIYNPSTIGFKKEVLSDVPFSFLLLSGVLLFRSERRSIIHFVITGLVWGFALSVRGIGASLLLALGFILCHKTIRYFLKKDTALELRLFLRKSIVIIFAAFGFYFLLNSILFPIPSGNILGFYANAVEGQDYGKWLLLNLNYYYEVFLNFFATMGGSFQMLSTFTKYFLVILIIPGIAVAFFLKPGFDDWLFVAYLLVLLIYPYLGGGFRFLIPALPFILKYIFVAADRVQKFVRVKSPVPIVAFLIVILLQYIPGNIDQAKSMSLPEEGPNEIPAVRTFNYIHNLPGEAIVVFLKPRALSFYSGRKSAYVARNIRLDQLPALFNRMNAHYFLICNENEEVDDVLLKSFIAVNKGKVKLIWKDNYFELYSDL